MGDGRYEAFVVRMLAGVIFAVALIPLRPPRVKSWVAFGVAAVGVTAYLVMELVVDAPLSALSSFDQPNGMSLLLSQSTSVVAWSYILLAFTAAVGANRQHRLGNLPDWLLVAIVLWTGALLHDALWPAPFNAAVLTTGDVLRLGFTVTVAIGAVVELRRIAAERAKLLTAEQEYSRRLSELAQVRADFNAMVIHELGSPATTIRNFTEVLAEGELRPADQAAIVAMMRSESERMLHLIDDVQSAVAVERDEFSVVPQPVAVRDVLADAAAFASGIRCSGSNNGSNNGSGHGEHEVDIQDETGSATVLADPMRIGQVLRNLLGNAAKYTPAGTQISLRAIPTAEGRVRFEVADDGSGIDADDLGRIFEKFGRGHRPTAELIAGKGLGLYLSRRIVRLHGGDLSVTSPPGAGAVFAFDLKTTRYPATLPRAAQPLT
jgi:signal transduction histidine kinase